MTTEDVWRWVGRSDRATGKIHLVRCWLTDDGLIGRYNVNGRYLTACESFGPFVGTKLSYPAALPADVCDPCWRSWTDEILSADDHEVAR